MTEALSVLLRALIYQADRRPGTAAICELKRGLKIRVTRVQYKDSYMIECGRIKKHTDAKELTTVAWNWPGKVETPIVWTNVDAILSTEIHWSQALMTPIKEEGSDARTGA